MTRVPNSVHANIASNHRRRSVLVPPRELYYLAAAKSSIEHSREFISDGYPLNYCRSLGESPTHVIISPMRSTSKATLALLPPLPIEGQPGRPVRGPRKRKRICSNCKFHSSSRCNEPAVNLAATRRSVGNASVGPNPSAIAPVVEATGVLLAKFCQLLRDVVSNNRCASRDYANPSFVGAP